MYKCLLPYLYCKLPSKLIKLGGFVRSLKHITGYRKKSLFVRVSDFGCAAENNVCCSR